MKPCVLSSESDGSEEECCIPFLFVSSELLVSSPQTYFEDLGGMLSEDSKDELEDVSFEDCSFNLKEVKILNLLSQKF